MAGQPTADFRDSQIGPPPDATRVGSAPADTVIEVSLYLKCRGGEAQALAGAADPRAALATHRTQHHKDDIALVRAFAAGHGLDVVTVEPARRLIRLSGTVAALQAAFGTRIDLYRQGDREFRARTGMLHLPADLLPLVEAVLGLDDRPAAFAKAVAMTAPAPAGYRPDQVAALYDFPTGVSGAGQCIAIIELGGGYLDSDNQAAFAAMGLAVPAIVAIPIDGGANSPGQSKAADQEVALDLQVAGGAAPGAKLAVYFAPASFTGFVDAVSAAVHDTVQQADRDLDQLGRERDRLVGRGAAGDGLGAAGRGDAAHFGLRRGRRQSGDQRRLRRRASTCNIRHRALGRSVAAAR